ncbi:MAG: hypothetical protein IJ672_04900, partial [Methanobrevibacter sp.]|nr:hypothetical protein [Methanobrevibacter sp.]
FKNYYNSKDLHNDNTSIPIPLITYSIDSADIILMHYYTRSIEEWNIKMERRRIDTSFMTKYKETPSCGSNKYDNSSYLNYFNPF